MTFEEEPTYYIKGILSDLKGAWLGLRAAVVNLPGSEIQGRLLFHIDDGMSWESVRNFNQMHKAIVLITNIVSQEDFISEEVQMDLADIREIFNEIQTRIRNGERI